MDGRCADSGAGAVESGSNSGSNSAPGPEPDAGWRFFDLVQDADGHRGPRLRLEESLDAGASDAARAASRMYWAGAGASWGDLTGSVAAGRPVALLPERSGLVVLDCDVKAFDERGYVVTGPGRAVWGGGAVRRGVDDLVRVVRGLGHEAEEVLSTFTVETKSGGLHLYFRCAPGLMRSSGHRENWLVDVKASANCWVVVPPTAGYRVVDGRAAAVMPEWLRAWIMQLGVHTEPLGGRTRAERRVAAMRAGREGQRTVARISRERGLSPDGAGHATRDHAQGLYEAWVADLLSGVREANWVGGWNQEIYNCACTLAEMAVPDGDTLSMIVEAAAPWDERERRSVERTVASAQRKIRRETGAM